MKKVCATCGEEKPLKKFDKNGGGSKLRKTCRKCRSGSLKTKLHKKIYRQRRKYGITSAEIGPEICMVCESTKSICIDHCHETGRIRGLLCKTCNTGIGMLGDNLSGLEKAVQYIKRFLEKWHGR